MFDDQIRPERARPRAAIIMIYQPASTTSSDLKPTYTMTTETRRRQNGCRRVQLACSRKCQLARGKRGCIGFDRRRISHSAVLSYFLLLGLCQALCDVPTYWLA
ncbi:hypothetical protein XA68_10078 [Ophiocordyceps unilateralis]|uniref:Uncharacterized protein n=1 Tax=Ophiocordyceps unilateralis TaxID=268505 RepID=A0A2A9PRG7_OPHUN|nr:hypothetical protein XA68_10078 [Ophiocordyceps unilateralis]